MTTTRTTHATPGALYGHSFDRDFECDSILDDIAPEDIPEGIHDLAWQMIHAEPGINAKVMMGGGKKAFYPKDPEVGKL